MIQHKTFTVSGGFNAETVMESLRRKVENYINRSLQSQRVINVTEIWKPFPFRTTIITIWYETTSPSPIT
jgi:hypothetical protein